MTKDVSYLQDTIDRLNKDKKMYQDEGYTLLADTLTRHINAVELVLKDALSKEKTRWA